MVSPTPPDFFAESANKSATPPDAQVGLPSEEDAARVIAACQDEIGAEKWRYCLPEARAILDLIRPAFEAKEREIGQLKLEVNEERETNRISQAVADAVARDLRAKLAQAVEALEPFVKFEETLRSWHSGKYEPPWSEDQKEWPRHLPVLRRHRPVDAETSMFAELYRSDFERARSAAAMGEKAALASQEAT